MNFLSSNDRHDLFEKIKKINPNLEMADDLSQYFLESVDNKMAEIHSRICENMVTVTVRKAFIDEEAVLGLVDKIKALCGDLTDEEKKPYNPRAERTYRKIKIIITGEDALALAKDAIADINCMDGDHKAFIEGEENDH